MKHEIARKIQELIELKRQGKAGASLEWLFTARNTIETYAPYAPKNGQFEQLSKFGTVDSLVELRKEFWAISDLRQKEIPGCFEQTNPFEVTWRLIDKYFCPDGVMLWRRD